MAVMLPPGEVSVEGGVLVFYVENQSVVRWGIRLSELGVDDPPVVVPVVSPPVPAPAEAGKEPDIKAQAERDAWTIDVLD